MSCRGRTDGALAQRPVSTRAQLGVGPPRRAVPADTVGQKKEKRTRMIPTMILFGLVFGRWWRTAVAVGAFLWPLILVSSGLMRINWDIWTACGLGVANTIVGVLVHQAILGIVRHLPGAATR
jgi:hypothetical protein